MTDTIPAYPPRHHEMPLDGRAPDATVVSAILWLRDGRYLMQRRDDLPGLPLRGHWALFGGHVEPGEDHAAAFVRELEEELAFRPREFAWYYETISALPRVQERVMRKIFYVVPIAPADVDAMVLQEGADKRLFRIEEMLTLPNIAPWDLAAMMMHARERTLFR